MRAVEFLELIATLILPKDTFLTVNQILSLKILPVNSVVFTLGACRLLIVLIRPSVIPCQGLSLPRWKHRTALYSLRSIPNADVLAISYLYLSTENWPDKHF